MNIRMVLVTCGLVLAALAIHPGAALADEILGQIEEAIVLYKQGDYAGAASGLDFAATQIRQLQAGRVSEALPEPLTGWKAAEAETAAMSGAMFGGGITAERSYVKDDAQVDIQIVGEAPMLQAVLMMFNNPMMMSGSGKKLTRIKSQKAALEYDKDDQSGEIIIVVQNSVMVTVKGSDVSQEDLRAYADAIDYDLISKLASGG
jgi:hypothetical protein